MIKIIKIPLYKLIQININNNSKNNQFNILLNQVKNILKINQLIYIKYNKKKR